MRRYLETEFVRFLREVDRQLTGAETMLVIGGAACSLAYGASRATEDIDTASVLSAELESAVQMAQELTGLAIPVNCVTIFDGPYHFEDRLCKLQELDLVNLEVLIPERHDLALMKILRGDEHDIQVIEQIHKQHPLEYQTLIELFIEEMGHVLGQSAMIRLNFLGLIERLFGTDVLESAKVRTKDWGSSTP